MEILEIDYVTYCAKDILFLSLVCSSLNWSICVFLLSQFKMRNGILDNESHSLYHISYMAHIN